MTDHYVTLGVAKDATKKDIKSAYRKLASINHPDKNTGDEDAATDRMKPINEAYEVLSHDGKRAEYDLMQQHGGSTIFGNGGTHSHTWSTGNMGDMFDTFRREHARRQQQEQEKRNRMKHMQTELTLEECYTGKTVDCEFGIITIPRGIRNGTRMMIGDHQALLTIYVKQHVKYKRANDDLLIDVSINSFEAMLGTELTLTHLDGKKYAVKIPEGIQPGHLIKMASKGMPNPEHNHVGDLLFRINIVTATDLTKKEKNAIMKLNKTRKHEL